MATTELVTRATRVKQGSFLAACRGENSGRLPLWVMRQAGRYLPEYQAVREKVSFLELCRSPELVAEVTEQPVRRFGFDAAILFSDILPILEGFGLTLTFPGGGPKIHPQIRTPDDVKKLNEYDVVNKLAFVYAGVREIKKRMPDTPLIGFAGSPWTLACYAVEGSGSANFNSAKEFINRYPGAGRRLLDMITDATSIYLTEQIKAGVDAIQIFDSWGGVLAHDDYRDWSLKYISRIFEAVKGAGVPRILFVNNLAPYIDLVRDIECEVVSVDYRMKLSAAETALPGKALQGNFDPTALFAPADTVAKRVTAMLESVTDLDRLIVNLGHGILPHTPLESVSALVETVHSFRR